ncbi:MAG: hypothetical protein FJ256_07930 [Phycisphaerae bacterium]|nr:hypothetical protein [Phycisphaerae bacterium]
MFVQKSPVKLVVSAGYERDDDFNRVRMDKESLSGIGASTGDVVQLLGKKTTAAICLPLFSSDDKKKIIGMGHLVRKNSGVDLGDTIEVRKIVPRPAKIISIRTLDNSEPENLQYITEDLANTPVTIGDILSVPYFGKNLKMEIMKISPDSDSLVLTGQTVFEILKSD